MNIIDRYTDNGRFLEDDKSWDVWWEQRPWWVKLWHRVSYEVRLTLTCRIGLHRWCHHRDGKRCFRCERWVSINVKKHS